MKKFEETILESAEEPETVVRAIWQEAHAMGGNDFEPSAFETILEQLKLGKLTGEEAVREARRIRNSKEEYH